MKHTYTLWVKRRSCYVTSGDVVNTVPGGDVGQNR